MERAGALIIVVLCEESGLDEFVAAAEVCAGVFPRRDVALGLRLGLVERGPVVAVVDFVEKIAFCNIGAVGCRLGLDVARDLGLERDVADRFRASRVFEVQRQRSLLHGRHGYGYCRPCRRGGRRCRRRAGRTANIGCGDRDAGEQRAAQEIF
jgi:hypothetical protein